MAETFEQIQARYLDLLLRELPEDVYADSGRVVDVGGSSEPYEIHKRSLKAKAGALALLEQDAVILSENTSPVTVAAEIDAWERQVLQRTYPDDDIVVRRARVIARRRAKGGLSIPFIRARIAEILGYEPIVTTLSAEGWQLGTSGLDVDANLNGGEFDRYTILVRLSTDESAQMLADLDELLTRIEPARSNHIIYNNTPDIEFWRLGTSSLGTTTNLGS